MNSLADYTPGGSQTLSKMHNRYVEVYPKTIEMGRGGLVRGDDGHDYIDLISGLGAVSVGYADPVVNQAAFEQMQKGTVFSLPHRIEYELAQKLTELVPTTEQWKFGKNGTDGTVMAVRAARALTGRMKIMTVGYNGCADVFECQGVRTAGIPEVLKQFNTRAVYNDLNSFDALLSKEYACVLMEPMIYEQPKPYFLEQLRGLCSRTGTLLIFDEVVNGGRFEGFLSSSYFDVNPDMYVIGKGIANGFPICAVGASRHVMQVFERDNFFASGTFGGECVSIAAALATVEILLLSIPRMVQQGSRIKEAFNKLNWPEGTRCIGYPTRLNFVFPSLAHKALFWQSMCLNKVLVGYANFIKASNTDKEVTAVINAIFKSYKILKDYWSNPQEKLIGPLPTEALKGRSN